jgi:hypothetical protein
MPIDTALRALADHLEASASDGVAIERVSAATDGDDLTAELTVEYPLELAANAETVTVTDSEYRDGGIHVDVSMTVDTAALTETTAQERSEHSTERVATSDETAEDVPAYKDPELLREVYDTCDSFAAMQEALDVDVTAQTVRRNMIKHGIHDPSTNASGDDTERGDDGSETDDSGGADDSETDTLSDSEETASPPSSRAFDDTDLPDSITPEDVRDAVAESSSLHGAQLALDLDMRETRSLLKELGVLDHVTGRLADKDDDPDPAEIERQIYDSLTARADGGESAH